MGCMHRQFNITFVANLSKQQAHVNSTFHDNRLAVPLCKIIIIKCDLRWHWRCNVCPGAGWRL